MDIIKVKVHRVLKALCGIFLVGSSTLDHSSNIHSRPILTKHSFTAFLEIGFAYTFIEDFHDDSV